MRGSRWWLVALSWLTLIIGGTVAGYIKFATQRPVVIGLGVAALSIFILEALYREYASSSESERRNGLLQVIADAMNDSAGLADKEGRAYGGWWTSTAQEIEAFDVGYAAEFRRVNQSLPESLRKLEDIMRAIRAQGSHLGRGAAPSKAASPEPSDRRAA